jgi:hypothetical protein
VAYHLRPARESDTAYVVTTFAQSFAESAMVAGSGSGLWPAEARRVLDGLRREGSVLLVAAYDGDDDTIAGWALGNAKTHTLDYVYVRAEMRRHAMPGSTIAYELVAAIGEIQRVTFKPPKGRVKIPRGWVFAPRFTVGAAAT